MRMYDLILKKREGGTLTDPEIQWIITQYTAGSIPDYQMSALLMAIYFKGLDARETATLTLAMADSGDRVDLSSIPGVKVDKHSTGGVGDKTTLILAPIVAACGVPVAKMSGRGLGHTGGTVDKLEAIPGFQTTLPPEAFLATVKAIGLSVIGQSGNLAPADKKLYALRDVTATVDSIPLIAASIMSKKIAAGADCILLDVKTGSGAFMKTREDAIRLAQTMVEIGEQVGRHTVALITDMDRPLGRAIGNSLEVVEAIHTLSGNGPADLTRVSLELAANMLFLAGKGDLATCAALAREAILSGAALEKLRQMVEAQGGDPAVIDEPERFPPAGVRKALEADTAGYITHMDTQRCGTASVALGAGRTVKDAPIDFAAGILLEKQMGDRVEVGDRLAILYAADDALLAQGEEILRGAITITDREPQPEQLIYARVSRDGVEEFPPPEPDPFKDGDGSYIRTLLGIPADGEEEAPMELPFEIPLQ